mgnify:CR=1 FL=1
MGTRGRAGHARTVLCADDRAAANRLAVCLRAVARRHAPAGAHALVRAVRGPASVRARRTNARVSRDLTWAATTADLHTWLAWSTAALAALHVGAALKHQWIDRDAVLTHMLPRPGWRVALASGIGLILLVGVGAALLRQGNLEDAELRLADAARLDPDNAGVARRAREGQVKVVKQAQVVNDVWGIVNLLRERGYDRVKLHNRDRSDHRN